MRPAGAILLLVVTLTAAAVADEDEWLRRRQRMVDLVKADARATAVETGRMSFDDRVFAALAQVPRHRFVPADVLRYAYDNRPLPIGFGQTISQPYIVALMTDLLDLDRDDNVLEVGTGSGYQAAVLGELVERVRTIEIIPELGEQARERLERLGYDKIEVRIGDGYYGWPEHAPFDGILVAAAASHIPPPLVEQLAPGGRMVIPVGGPFTVQQLMLVTRTDDGKVRTRQILPVAFVPLTGGH